jgi:hypothetical protein
MTNVSQIKSLPDGTAIERIEFELVSLGEKRAPKQAGWASSWIGKIKDGTEVASVTFSLKKGGPEQYVGKRIVLTSGKNAEGALTGIKTKANGQYINLWVTDSAKITIAGDSQPFTPTASAPSVQRQQATPTVTISAEAHAKHLATEWCTVYDWTAPIFETRLNKEQIKECVTGIVIEMRRSGVKILDPYKDNWREVEFKGEKLGSWKGERIKGALIKVWQGAKVIDQVRDALNAAAKEPEYSPSVVFRYLLGSEGIDDDDAVDAVLLRNYKAVADMTEEDYKEVISDPKFAENVKQFVASKPSLIDEDDSIEL